MKKRNFWLGGTVIAIIVIVTGVLYTSHFASAVSQTQAHTAAGAATVPTNITPVVGFQTFQIVSAQTTASYSVFENLVFENKPNNDAIGTTHSIQGNFGIKTGSSPLVANMNITVDLRTLQSDASRRDNFIQQNTLQTDQYPTATFVSVSAKNLPANYSDGQTVHFQLTGNLTMHGKTNKEVFDVQGKVEGTSVTGKATSTIYMTDFGMQPPDLANIAIAQNKVLITLDFTAKAA
jgi:polyisoprenoid-binding protein YceI